MRIDGRTVRLHCDRRGAVVAATGEEGGLIWRARLKAFGEALIDVAEIEQPWRLANQYCDEESGLHYNLARHYHPGLGRYLSEDPLFDPTTRGNWYQYAAGDPLGRADPTGEFIIPAVLIAMAVGAVVGAAISAGIKAYETRGQDWNADRWKQIGVAAAVGGVGGAVGAGAGALAVGALGLAGAVGVGAVLGGAIDGGVSSVAQGCAEAAIYNQAISGQQLLKDAAIGVGIGALTAGIGARIARGFSNKAGNVAARKLDDALKLKKPLVAAPKPIRSKVTPAQMSADSKRTGIPEEKIHAIILTKKPYRPDPKTYIDTKIHEEKLAKFDKGASKIMLKSQLDKYGPGQSDGTSFVMPKAEVDQLLAKANGDPKALADALGIPVEQLEGNGLVRVDIPSPRDGGLRIPSGNEAGANSQWIPGGTLPDGGTEAVIDIPKFDPSSIIVTPL